MFIQSNDADVKTLAVFETPPTNTLVMERHFLNFHPVLGITPTTNVIHFSVKGLSLKYVDLQCSNIVFPINHLLQSMWEQVKVYLGGKLVSSGSSNYHYKSMIKTFLYKCQNERMKKQFCLELFYEDTQGAHDSLNDSPMNEGSYY